MEQEKFLGRNQWYHETQSRRCAAEIPSVLSQTQAGQDRFLLGCILTGQQEAQAAAWLPLARDIAAQLLPETVRLSAGHSLSCYERLTTALTVAQVCGVQRLCSHYSARLAPLSSPDSSRQANLRLTHITQFARQLASEPSRLSSQSLAELAECGFSAADMVTFAHIVGFIGFQARAISLWQAQQKVPVRHIPGFSSLEPADYQQFSEDYLAQWAPCLPPAASALQEIVPGQEPDDTVTAALFARHHPWLTHDSVSLRQLNKLLSVLSRLSQHQTNDRHLMLLITAQIHGSAPSFHQAQQALTTPSTAQFRPQDPVIFTQSQVSAPRQQALVDAGTLLTCSPQRFDERQWSTLNHLGVQTADGFNLLIFASLAGWLNRLELGLGHTLNRPKTLPF